ncbi:ElyC/SanA/YdcF family protein [Ferruginibacter paludis]|uniref:YdcF family protein n=1 Tax=Ferruginibacter paludis TaxID=1310417 RepID=UPI0025B4EBB9|nr:ElyC/SanA/YdcF family protein [Ferruginibacter paludis]MDN3655987.1 ElyC/SanA/YdcF family protein [Ferruginibacter paludis]
MSNFLYALKGQFTVLNLLILLLALAFIFNRYKRRRTAIIFISGAILIFLICSTAYLPNYLAGKLESKYLPYPAATNFNDSERVLIHVLGSGYVLDKRLPPNAQIGWCALGRLAEAIRVHRMIKNSTIICSGYSSLGLETQAQVTKRAAIVLGVDSSQLETLNLPSTTQEEASELSAHYSKKSHVIIVTDAIHMPRAIKLFAAQGFNPIAAPTNYKINEGPVQEDIKWLPSFERIGLMNYVIHEYLGNLKATLQN